MKIAITGATGNMGQAVIKALTSENYIEEIRLLSHSPKRTKKLLNKVKKLKKKTVIIEGSIADGYACRKLVEDVDLVLNMSAVIPPKSDQSPQRAVECNEVDADVWVTVIEHLDRQPTLLHISTVALYGNRSEPHRFGRVGDPLLVSPFDIYSATKLRGEFRVLESGIKRWAVFRQTAMLHPNMLTDNLSDGLMFHTCFDAPLEWVTAHDSGILIRNFLRRVHAADLPQTFWKRCYNIGGGAENRLYGYQTYNDGFAIIGGSTTCFFSPGYNATRNFHGVWYSDSDELNELFDFQQQTSTDYWREILKAHPIFKAGKLVPKKMIRRFAIKRLLKNYNSPAYWAKHKDIARLKAYFGGEEAYESLQKKSWKEAFLPEKYDPASGICDNETPVFYGYDISKQDSEITIGDLESVASAHGGRLISEQFETGDMYAKIEWETQDGERFVATPYTVLRAGHWYNSIYHENVWDFDRLSKKDAVFASVWYDSHDENENMRYSFDKNFTAHAVKFYENSDHLLLGNGEHRESRKAV